MWNRTSSGYLTTKSQERQSLEFLKKSFLVFRAYVWSTVQLASRDLDMEGGLV